MNLNLRNITNHYQDVKLVSLSSWRQASEINPRDRNGPYVVMQDGYDPQDMKMIPDQFVLGKSGKWLSLGYFYKMSVAERRAEYIFGTTVEVVTLMNSLPTKAELLRPSGKDDEKAAAPAPEDEMAAALRANEKSQPGAGQ